MISTAPRPTSRFTSFTRTLVRTLTRCLKFQLTRNGTPCAVAMATRRASSRYFSGKIRSAYYLEL